MCMDQNRHIGRKTEVVKGKWRPNYNGLIAAEMCSVYFCLNGWMFGVWGCLCSRRPFVLWTIKRLFSWQGRCMGALLRPNNSQACRGVAALLHTTAQPLINHISLHVGKYHKRAHTSLSSPSCIFFVFVFLGVFFLVNSSLFIY